jgi:HlyD family secretion protein
MDRRLRNRILLFLLIAGLVAFGLVKLSERKPVAKITAVMPGRENIASSISSNGKVEPIAPYIVRAQLDTFVEAVNATEGQQVKKGQLLLELNVRDAQAKLAEARSGLLRAEDDLRAAQSGGRSDEAARTAGALASAIADRDRLQRNHDALERLIAQQAATRDELTANDLALAKAKTQVAQLEAAKNEFDRSVKLQASQAALQIDQQKSLIASLQDKVGSGRITAPIDGTLYSLPVHKGDFVNVGTLLAEMADLHKVRVRAFIDEPELGGLEPGQAVKISWDALPNRSWSGQTEVIPKQVVARGTRSVGELLCSVDNEKLELLPNVNVNVRINSQERKNVLTIPRGAVENDGGARFVFVVKNGELGVGTSTLERRSIQVGIADATSYEVLSGLHQDDRVALPGDFELRDGMAVRVIGISDASVRGEKSD